jgi:uncharacterized damage-inducible protein DinB
MKWFERTFAFDLPAERLPGVLQRLRAMPARLEAAVSGLGPGLLTARPADGSWSIQENAGHLLDLEALWLGRVEDFATGRPALRAADLTNRRTHEAAHHARTMAAIVSEFRAARTALLTAVAALDESAAAATSKHPRLEQPMRLIDHLYFVAEHDDHHLMRIGDLRNPS